MASISDFLTADKVRKYEEGWSKFNGRYRVNSSRNVHSGMPVISEVYQFEHYPIFRAHVFGRRLRRFDPYFICSEHPMPFWNAQHYLMVGEQMYSAVLHLVIGEEYNTRVAKEVPVEFNWKKPVFFVDNVSIELIRQEEGRCGGYDKEVGYFTIYSDKRRKVLSRMSAVSFWRERSYVQDIERITAGDKTAIDDLVRKIEAQAITHTRLRKPRNQFKSNKTNLISLLRQGNIPEEELHDFFSLWE